MGRHFALTVRLHEPRYHGADEWPPAPARVFQALVAGVAQGRRIPADAVRALEFLASLSPPVIAAPPANRGQRVSLFVPNNDLDAVGGDPGRIGEIRTKKVVQPYLLEGDAALLYAWPLPEDSDAKLIRLADGLFQLGRGIDPAWAVGEILDDERFGCRLRAHRGTIHYPTSGDGSIELAAPTNSTLTSIVLRFEASLARLRSGDSGRTHFFQPPKAHFAMVRYDGTPRWHLFELRRESNPAKSSPWAARRATEFVEQVRDAAVSELVTAFPARKADVERILVGRKPDGASAGPISERVRLVPLPSIGHEHADHSIRRVLVQIPPGPLSERDVLWGLSGRVLINGKTGELGDTMLAAATVDEMVARYLARSRTWTSVTPLALGTAMRRRIDPKRQREEAKGATEREAEERNARWAVGQALRHAGIQASVVGVHVQREPFESNGTRAELFATETRFAKEALWHVRLELDRDVRGPLVLGDGRFVGLGVMAPSAQHGVFAFTVEGGLPRGADSHLLARALRRAVLARVQSVLRRRGEQEMPAIFHGHEQDGAPLRRGNASHLAYVVDVARSRFLIVPPHLLDRRDHPYREESWHLATLKQALGNFTTLRAGHAGLLNLRATAISSADPVLQRADVFESATDYMVTRHLKKSSAEETVVVDVQRECQRRNLPAPKSVRITSIRAVAGIGVLAHLKLTFAVAVAGPILLGRTRYLGGGLFLPGTSSS
jgi:CRISPR-associated protein Csb2